MRVSRCVSFTAHNFFIGMTQYLEFQCNYTGILIYIYEMNFDQTIATINTLLSKKRPETFNSSWILKHTPQCYRFICQNVRTETSSIDWVKITYALEWKYQRRWAPGRMRKNPIPHEDTTEVKTIIDKYRNKLYVFIAPQDLTDKRIRDIISITLVRLAQNGNLSAEKEVMKLVTYTVNDWLEKYYFLNRWQGYEDGIQKQLTGCIRRYRYTGSFLNYVFRTLEYSGRGIRPFYAYSLDEPVAWDAEKRKIENVVQDSETGEIKIYN